MSWTHVVIELYSNDDGTWPDGDAAEWIEKGLVGWCLSSDDVVIYHASLWIIFRVLLTRAWDKLSNVCYNITHRIPPVRARRDRQWEKLRETFFVEVEWVENGE